MRVFDLASMGYTGTFVVNGVEVAIEQATSGGGSQPATLNLYSLSGPLSLANLTLLATEAVTVADQFVPTVLNIPLTTALSLPPGTTLVIEFFTPDGSANGDLIFVGSNPFGQTGDTYLAAADCGITEPTSVADIGFPDMHWVMNVLTNAATVQTDGTDRKSVV